jgi:NDP-sugar pyrophosphorylase family protein
MQGVILAAGRGKRLHPVTTQRTKAMAPVAGKPMVARVVDQVVDNGIHDLIVIVSPDDPLIVPYFQEARPDLAIRFIMQTERLGMAHALSLAAPYLHDDFLVSACDNLTSVAHIAQLIATHGKRAANATLSLMPIDIAEASSTGIIAWAAPSAPGWVQRIVEKPKPEEAPSNISSLPLYLFSPRLLDYLPQVQRSPRGEYELQDAIQLLIEQAGRVTGLLTERRTQLTHVADLLALNRHYLAVDPQAARILSAAISPESTLIPPVRIEPGVTIGAGCLIGPNVLLEAGCSIEENVEIREAIVLRGGRVTAGQVIAHTVVL